jgi:hypothetical protein
MSRQPCCAPPPANVLRSPASKGTRRAKAKRSCFAEVWKQEDRPPDYVVARAEWCQLVSAVAVESGNGASLAAIYPTSALRCLRRRTSEDRREAHRALAEAVDPANVVAAGGCSTGLLMQ